MSTNHIGSKLAIATGRPATIDAQGFAALDYVEAAEGIISIGSIGDTNETITVPDVTTGRNMTLKGARTGNTVNIAVSRKRVLSGPNEGQLIAAQAAFKAAAQAMGGEYSLRVTEADGSIQYFAGNVMNYAENERTTSSFAGFSFDVTMNYDPIDVDPD